MRTLGAVGVVEVDKPVNMAVLQDFFVERGVWVRPFNRNVYLMPPYCIGPEDLRRLTDAIVDAVRGPIPDSVLPGEQKYGRTLRCVRAKAWRRASP